MKKLLATLLATTMAVSAIGGLVACGGDDAKGQTLTVWAPEAAHECYKQLAEQWKSSNEKYKNWTVNFEAKSEGEAETDFGADPGAGADIFFFESGNVQTLKDKLYLQELTPEYSAAIKARDGANADFILDEDNLAWAFPTTSDNGYFLWYDKTFFNENEVGSLDTMLQKINTYNTGKEEAQKKHFRFKYDDGWYQVSWFFGLGCEMDWVGETKNYYTNIHNTPEGLAAGKASIRYLSDPAMLTGDDGIMTAGFGNGSIVAGVGGTWLKSTLEQTIAAGGRTYDSVIGAAKLPTFKATVEGQTEKDYQMGSFMGGKFCGINRYKNNVETITASMSLADFLTNEAGQLARFNATGAVPSNQNLANSAAVKGDMLAGALAEQNKLGGYPQKSQDGLWDAMAEFGTGCHDGGAEGVTEANLQEKLNNLATAMAKGGTLVTSK